MFGADAVSISVTNWSYGLSSFNDCRNHASKCFVRGVADAVGAVAEQVAVPVAPVIDPGRAVEQLVDQLVALVGCSAATKAMSCSGVGMRPVRSR